MSGLGGGQIRPSWRNLWDRARQNKGAADLTLGTYHEKVGLEDPENVATSVPGLTAPAIGSDVVIVNRALEEGSVVLTGDYEEGVDYEIVYGSSSTSLHNLTITPGTSLSVLYFEPDPQPDGSHTHNGLVPVGGDTGEILKKNSPDDYDYSWQADAGSGGGGGFPRSLVLEDETVTIEEYEQMPVYQEIRVEGTLIVEGALIIYE
jgi:hypothetical protein